MTDDWRKQWCDRSWGGLKVVSVEMRDARFDGEQGPPRMLPTATYEIDGELLTLGLFASGQRELFNRTAYDLIPQGYDLDVQND